LRALSDDAFERLTPDLKTIKSSAKQVFHKHGTTVSHVYFPNGGVISSTAVLADGTMIETATIGREGMVGIEAFFGDHPVAPGQTMMQVPDTSVEMLSVAAFRRELARQGSLASLMGRYAQAAVALLMQSAACNARHQVHERCCRWLLMTHDRVGQDRFTLSQEFLAMMLGVSRQSVTMVAGTLQKAGLITYKHGQITVVDRPSLEAGSCECYDAIRRRFEGLRSEQCAIPAELG
jgi:CRP-like cAMP-binding protein